MHTNIYGFIHFGLEVATCNKALHALSPGVEGCNAKLVRSIIFTYDSSWSLGECSWCEQDGSYASGRKLPPTSGVI